MAHDPGFKTANIETAIALWELFLTEKCRFMKEWIKFIQKKEEDGLKAISKDVWEMLYELIDQTDGDIKKFVDDGSWPVLIDEFVAFASA